MTPDHPDPGAGTAAVFDICGPLPTGGATTQLEASAGTGKTWTIAALVTRLVAEGTGRLEEMLVVTFGRAASQELRERVRAQLVEAERALSACLSDRSAAERPGGAGAPESSLTAFLCDVGPTERRERRDRLRDALTDFDSATIATTHQFCQLVLRSLGVAGDTDAGSELVENLDDLLVEVVDDLYVRGFGRSEEEPAFDRRTALGIARAAVGDPQARLEPTRVPEGTVAARRYRFAQAVRTEMDLRKRRLGILSYDDLLGRLAAALEDPQAPARDRMRARWRFVLVDEFQDTDPVQWQVLDRAFSGHATMVLIGDPKQAIYAFRGGDVVTYLDAEATAQHHATLGTNHRSDAGLLSAVQAVLRGAALGEEQIVVRDVEAQHREPRLVGAPRPAPFRLRVVDRSRFGVQGSRGVPVAQLRDAVADDLAADVGALLSSGATFTDRPLVAGDVAVLCETRRQCEIARAGLAAAGIQAVIAGSGSVYATAGADEWLCLLEAMEAPHRSARVRAAALTAFFGHDVAELDADDGDVLTTQVAETLREWADLMRVRGVAAVQETAVARHGVVARVLGRLGGERLLTDLRHVAESLHDTATRQRLGLTALLTWMRARVAEARVDVAGERTRRLDSDAAAVQILTIHGSKGLQFPVVYLPFVADQWVRTPDYPLFHDQQRRRCLDVGGPEADPAHVEAAMSEEAGEDLRLLYVAMTRAQCQLVTWWLPSARNTECAPLHRVLLGRRPGETAVPRQARVPPDDQVREALQPWQAAGGPTLESLDDRAEGRPAPGSGAPRLEARVWSRTVDPVWRRTSYTALASAAASHQPAGDGAASHQPAGDGAVSMPPSGDGAVSIPPTAAAVRTVTDNLVIALGSEPEDPPRDDEPDRAASGVPPASAGAGDRPGPGAGDERGSVRSPMADLPVGATFGSLVHAVLEHTDLAAAEHDGDLHAALLEQVHAQLVRWPVDLEPADLAEALVAVCETPLGDLAADRTLRQVSGADRMCELDFELPLAGGDRRDHPRRRARLSDLGPLLRRHLPAGDPLLPYADVLDAPGYATQLLHGYLTGSVDALLRIRRGDVSTFVVVDYKTNWLGDPDTELTAHHYRPAALVQAMTHSSYPLQALLYAVVLHRFLRWRLAGYEPARHLGGVMYLYVRGMCGPQTPVIDGQPCGVFAWRPPEALVTAVSDLLDGLLDGPLDGTDAPARGSGRGAAS